MTPTHPRTTHPRTTVPRLTVPRLTVPRLTVPRLTVPRLTVLLCALLLALAGCSDDSPSPQEQESSSSGAAESPTGADSPDSPEPPRRPKVGDCYRLTWKQAVSPTGDQARVPCRRKVTATTFAVGRVERTKAGKPRAVDSVRVQRQVARVCPQRLPRFLGGSQEQVRLSVFTAVWFTPTLEEAAAGADWFRCDVVATGPRRSLVPLPRKVRGALADATVRARFGLCAKGEPGRRSFTRVPCSQGHGWRAVTTVDVAGKAYPGRRAIESSMQDTCSDAAAEAASNPLDVRWSQEAPTKAQWRAGLRYGTCWVPD